MNPIPLVHFCAALIVMLVSVPMIRRKVKMNDWYGIRIPAAFESEAAWFDINHYGGRLLFAWAILIAATAMVGALLEKKYWLTYNWFAVAIIMGGLALVVAMIYRYARRRKSALK